MSPRFEGEIAQLAFAAHPVATLVVDLEGHALYSNSAAQKAFGFDQSAGSAPGAISDWQLHRMPLGELLRTASASSNWIPAIFFRDDQEIHARARGLRKDGSTSPLVLITSVADSTTPFLIHSQQIKELNTQLGLYQQTAKQLEASLAVSKVLERELVHRVKNNLAIISALLNQQARSTGDNIVSGALKVAASRIKSIAVVHDVLDAHQQSDFVNLREMLTQLIDGIRDALCPNHIVLEIESNDFKIHIDVALPLALLINELVTNAIKHAFIDRKSGHINVRCSAQNSEAEVRVVDDGIGISTEESGKVRKPCVITLLAEQLRGTIECRVENGSEWTIRFPTDVQRTIA